MIWQRRIKFKAKGGAVRYGEVRVAVLMYADDMVCSTWLTRRMGYMYSRALISLMSIVGGGGFSLM